MPFHIAVAEKQGHELASLPAIDGVGHPLLNNVTVCFPGLSPSCLQLDTNHVQVVRQDHVLAWSGQVFLLECPPPFAKREKLALLTGRVPMQFAA